MPSTPARPCAPCRPRAPGAPCAPLAPATPLAACCLALAMRYAFLDSFDAAFEVLFAFFAIPSACAIPRTGDGAPSAGIATASAKTAVSAVMTCHLLNMVPAFLSAREPAPFGLNRPSVHTVMTPGHHPAGHFPFKS